MRTIKITAGMQGALIPLGKQGENEAAVIAFRVADFLDMRPGASVALAVQPHDKAAYPAALVMEEGWARWTVRAADTAQPGDGKCELRLMLGDVIEKSITFSTRVIPSFEATGPVPAPVADWVTDAQKTLTEVQEAVSEAQRAAGAVRGLTASAEAADTPSATVTEENGLFHLAFGLPRGPKGNPGSPGQPGQPGRDGVSPEISVSAITGGHRITITTPDGTQTVDVVNGTDGDDGRGIVSIAKTGTEGQSDTYQITYTDGTVSTFTVTNGKDGKDGDDGYSPAASVSKSGGAATITITDKNGTTTAYVNDGEPGQPGVSPTITVTDITGGHRITITDATGAHSFDVMDGDVADAPVQDVQVAGTSVLDAQGVANVPVANANTVGVARPGASLSISNAGALEFRAVGASEVKAGTTYQRALTPERQHASAFYGLAKAAGSDEKNSSLSVGQYTAAAKHAILAMLGVSGIIGNPEGATASKAYAIGDSFLHAGALYKATAAIAANGAIVPGTNCVQTTIIDLIKEA